MKNKTPVIIAAVIAVILVVVAVVAIVINNNNNQLEYNFIDINFNLIFNDELKAYVNNVTMSNLPFNAASISSTTL